MPLGNSGNVDVMWYKLINIISYQRLCHIHSSPAHVHCVFENIHLIFLFPLRNTIVYCNVGPTTAKRGTRMTSKNINTLLNINNEGNDDDNNNDNNDDNYDNDNDDNNSNNNDNNNNNNNNNNIW